MRGAQAVIGAFLFGKSYRQPEKWSLEWGCWSLSYREKEGWSQGGGYYCCYEIIDRDMIPEAKLPARPPAPPGGQWIAREGLWLEQCRGKCDEGTWPRVPEWW